VPMLSRTDFQEKCRLEVEELKDENYGYELCQAIGRTYKAKAEHYAVSISTPNAWTLRS
jgi:hypothetical protein